MNCPLTEKYLATKQGRQFLFSSMMGPNAMRIAEELSSHLDITQDMHILDLGCGKGLSSILLNEKYGAMVFAADLWVKPSENRERFAAQRPDGQIVAVAADARKKLPFAHDYFDIIFSIDSYQHFGNNEDMLPSLLPFVKKGGYIAVAVPGLKSEFNDGLPDRLKPFFRDEVTFAESNPNFYTAQWWKELWSKAPGIELVSCCEMRSHSKAWEEWLQCPSPYARHDEEMMREENGEYYSLVQLIAKAL